MTTPKVNNDHFFLRKTQNSPDRNLFISRAHDIHGLDQNYVNFLGYRDQFQHPHRRKIFSQQNFGQLQHLYMVDPLNIVNSPNFELFSIRKAGTQCQNRGINIAYLKFKPQFIHLSILDVRMQDTDMLQPDPQILSESSKPHLLRPSK